MGVPPKPAEAGRPIQGVRGSGFAGPLREPPWGASPGHEQSGGLFILARGAGPLARRGLQGGPRQGPLGARFHAATWNEAIELLSRLDWAFSD